MNKKWTSEEIKIVTDLYGLRNGIKLCASRINRSEEAIRAKASKLGIKAKGRKKTPEEYLRDIKEKGIKYYPVEDYQGSLIPIFHKCEKGHLWLAKPSMVLAGQTSCPSCRTFGFSLEKSAIVYYIKLTRDNLCYYKIGLSNKVDPVLRFEKDSKEIKIATIKVWNFDSGLEAKEFEKTLLEKYRHKRVCVPELIKQGKTELFEEDVLNLDS